MALTHSNIKKEEWCFTCDATLIDRGGSCISCDKGHDTWTKNYWRHKSSRITLGQYYAKYGYSFKLWKKESLGAPVLD